MPEVTMNPQTDEKRRFVQPPVMDVREKSSPVFNVERSENEDVEWIWTHYSNGQSVITGYNVIKKSNGKTESNT
jgi:hypothetical protein